MDKIAIPPRIEKNLADLFNLLQSSKRVVVTTHHNPDGDALGSALAMGLYLSKKGHQVQVITPSTHPAFLDWMPGQSMLLVYDDTNLQAVQEAVNQADLIFMLDFSVYKRLQGLEKIFASIDRPKLVIDHHLDPAIDADFMLWDVRAASTTELVYDFLHLAHDAQFIDIPIAECIYAGVMTDTSSFKHASTTPKVHLMAAELMQQGLNTNRIHKLIYDTNTVNRLKLTGFALKDKLEILTDFRTAYFALSASELNQYQHEQGDTEGLVNYALSIRDIAFAAIFIERPEGVKISFRSIGNFPANEVARLYFNGGGHKNAAGGISHQSLQATVEQFLKTLPLFKEQLSKATY